MNPEEKTKNTRDKKGGERVKNKLKEISFSLIIIIGLVSFLPVSLGAPHPVYTSFSSPEQGILLNKINNIISVSDTAIYRIGYYSINGSAWQSFSLSGTSYNGNQNWLSGSVFKNLPDFGQGEHYIIIYSCTYNSASSSWDCHDDKWQLIIFTKTASGIRYLVREGIAVADIVVASNAPNMVKLAGNYFQKYISNITGVVLPISTTPNTNYNFHVYIGRSSYTDAMGITSDGCVNGGFRIVSGEGYLVLLGDDKVANLLGPSNYNEWDALTGSDRFTNDFLEYYNNGYNYEYEVKEEDGRGSINAVYEFLYGQGIRWYHPGWYEYPGLGTIIPKRNYINFDDINELVNPDYAMREFYMYSLGFGFSPYQYDGMFEEAFEWQMGLRGNSYYEFIVGSLGGPGHGIRAVIAREETEASHPEYYAVIDGVRMNGDDPVPDLCSPELLQANIRYIKKMFDTYNISMISVMPTDGFTSTSDRCTYMIDENAEYSGILSNYVWEYVNNVAWAIYEDSKYKDKFILAGAYTTYQDPPTNLSRPLAPNIALFITKWRTWTADEETKQHYKDITNTWYNLLPSRKVYTYDYYLQNSVGGNTQGVPMFFPQLTSEDLKFLNGKSQGEIIEISSTSEWPPWEATTQQWNLKWDLFAANSFNTYVTSRLYWDADLDIDALLEEYYTLFYGPARAQMKAFVEYSEAHLIDSIQDPTIIPTMRQMLANARATAGNTVYGHRIDLLIGLMNSVGTGEEQINSCEVLTAASTTYKLTADVTSTETCFIIMNGGVTLDCQGHKITYGTGRGENVHGVYMPYTGGMYATTIKNCNIIYTGPAGGDTDAIQFSTSHGATFINNTINATGTGIWLIASSDINVTGNRITSVSSVPFFTQEVYYGTVSNNRFSSNSGQGIYLYDAHNLTVTNNNASSVSSLGLNIVLGGNNTFINNRFTSVTGSGMSNYQDSGNIYINNTILP